MFTLGNCQIYSEREELSIKRDHLINRAAIKAIGVGDSMQDVWARFEEVNNNLVADNKESAYNALRNLYGTFFNIQCDNYVTDQLIASACYSIAGKKLDAQDVTPDALPETASRIKMTLEQKHQAVSLVKKNFLLPQMKEERQP